jgi:hypothetical protein
MNIADLTVPQLLLLHPQIGDELRKRGILRSANNPTGDLSEYLFCKAFAQHCRAARARCVFFLRAAM